MAKQVSSWLLYLVLVVAIGLGAWYWYRVTDSTCPVPLAYSIGAVDKRFGLSQGEVEAVVKDAESLWEKKTGRDLFIYDPSATLSINFIFDDRQKLTVEEHKVRDILDRAEDVNSSIKEQYEDLVAKYEPLADTYEARVQAYENALAKHNGEVAYWNTKGGAPKEMYERLNAEEQRLDTENKALSTLANTLNGLVDKINTLGAKGNKTVQDYNTQVTAYNNRFHYEREFTQGDYYQERINIYQFKDLSELRLVLAHELGHALSLGHVDDSKSVMYYLMEAQPTNVTLSSFDLAEFERVCGS